MWPKIVQCFKDVWYYMQWCYKTCSYVCQICCLIVVIHVFFSGGLLQFRQAKTEIVSASKVAYRFLLGVTSNVGSIASDSPSNSNRGSPGFQATWFKNLITTGAKPSTSTEIENQNENDDLHRQQRRQDAELLLQQNSRHNVWGYIFKICIFNIQMSWNHEKGIQRVICCVSM